MATSVPEPDLGGIPPPEVLALVPPGEPAKTFALAPAAHFSGSFECRVSWVADAAIVEVSGEVDIATAPALEHAITLIELEHAITLEKSLRLALSSIFPRSVSLTQLLSTFLEIESE